MGTDLSICKLRSCILSSSLINFSTKPLLNLMQPWNFLFPSLTTCGLRRRYSLFPMKYFKFLHIRLVKNPPILICISLERAPISWSSTRRLFSMLTFYVVLPMLCLSSWSKSFPSSQNNYKLGILESCSKRNSVYFLSVLRRENSSSKVLTSLTN